MKKLDELEYGGLIAEERGVIAHAYEVDVVDGGGYSISYHQGEMPAFNVEHYETIDGIEVAMRNFVNDLRKWRTPEQE